MAVASDLFLFVDYRQELTVPGLSFISPVLRDRDFGDSMTWFYALALLMDSFCLQENC